MKSVATRVQLARRSAGMTQADLAERLGVSRSAISQWERAEGSNPTAANLGNLALALACSFEWLATGRGNKRAGGKFPRSESADTAVQLRYFAKDDAEDHLLAAFRDLDHWDQMAVLSVVDTFVHREKRPGLNAKRRKRG